MLWFDNSTPSFSSSVCHCLSIRLDHFSPRPLQFPLYLPAVTSESKSFFFILASYRVTLYSRHENNSLGSCAHSQDAQPIFSSLPTKTELYGWCHDIWAWPLLHSLSWVHSQLALFLISHPEVPQSCLMCKHTHFISLHLAAYSFLCFCFHLNNFKSSPQKSSFPSSRLGVA